MRTSNMEDTINYLNRVKYLKILMDVSINKSQSTNKNLVGLKYSFFGDSILITCEIVDKKETKEYFAEVSYLITSVLAEALRQKILFRGALSIGNYIEESNIILGPAVVDAAIWHDRLDLFSVITTPSAFNKIRSFYSLNDPSFEETSLTFPIMKYKVPMKEGFLETYIYNWPMAIPTLIESFEKEIIGRDTLHWYFDKISRFYIPPGTENKYRNTEDFVRYSIKHKTNPT